jgi:hypothetical protein
MLPLSLKHNRIHTSELALVWYGYDQRWARVLYDYAGTYVEVDLMPKHPHITLNWQGTRSINIRRHHAPRVLDGQFKDSSFKAVQNGSIIFNAMKTRLVGKLDEATIATILYRDFLPEIDWDKYNSFAHRNGVFFRDVMKTPSETLIG